MDVVVTFAMQQSCLFHSSQSSDYAIKKAENEKFRKDAKLVGPIHLFSMKHFIPLAMNHFGLRGGHFNATLEEFASLLVTRPSGCSLMKGPFALYIHERCTPEDPKLMVLETNMDGTETIRRTDHRRHGLFLLRLFPTRQRLGHNNRV